MSITTIMSVSAEDQDKVFLHAMALMRDGEDGFGEICKTLKRNGITNIIGIFALKKSKLRGLIIRRKEKPSN